MIEHVYKIRSVTDCHDPVRYNCRVCQTHKDPTSVYPLQGTDELADTRFDGGLTMLCMYRTPRAFFF
jgi:hypothetical protein